MEKPGIQEVQDGMFNTPYVLVYLEPVIGFLVEHGIVITRGGIARVVPR